MPSNAKLFRLGKEKDFPPCEGNSPEIRMDLL